VSIFREPSFARAKEFLKEQRILELAESRTTRIVGEQRKAANDRAHLQVDHGRQTFHKLAHILDGLLVVKTDESVSALRRISQPAFKLTL
jgi:hypothetical protein